MSFDEVTNQYEAVTVTYRGGLAGSADDAFAIALQGPWGSVEDAGVCDLP
jgi:hypothetical protein